MHVRHLADRAEEEGGGRKPERAEAKATAARSARLAEGGSSVVEAGVAAEKDTKNGGNEAEKIAENDAEKDSNELVFPNETDDKKRFLIHEIARDRGLFSLNGEPAGQTHLVSAACFSASHAISIVFWTNVSYCSSPDVLVLVWADTRRGGKRRAAHCRLQGEAATKALRETTA
jgi:hypothetical protein